MTSAEQPLPQLYSGQTGSYFGTEYEGLSANVHPNVLKVYRMLISQSLNYLGKLTCSQFSNIDVYSYSTTDKKTAVSVMADSSGLAGIDCVSKFNDDSFLTTTTTKIISGAYDQQQLFRVSFPGLNATELLAQHTNGVRNFEQQHGAVQPIFVDLLSIAKLIDEYTVRQQSTPEHSFLQLAGGFAHASVAGMMGDNDDDWDDEDYDEDEIEYDLDSVSPLIRAILQDDLQQVKALIEDGVAVNPENRSWNEEVPLVAAVYRGDSEMIQTLIAAGAEIDRLDLNVDSFPLGMAIKQNRLDLVELLLNNGASEVGMNNVALVDAVGVGDLAQVKTLIKAGADVDYSDGSALVSAANRGNVEMIELLIQSGADVNLGWKTGSTPIAEAAYQGYLTIVKKLLNAGANPFQRCHDEESYDALGYAKQGKLEGHHKGTEHQAIIKLLNQR